MVPALALLPQSPTHPHLLIVLQVIILSLVSPLLLKVTTLPLLELSY